MRAARLGAFSVVAFAVLGLAWIALELTPVSLGLADGDDPASTLAYLRRHPGTYVGAGVALVLMAICLTVATFAVADALTPPADGLAVRTASAFGLFAAASFVLFGVLRLSTGPVLYIDDLDPHWGEGAYLVVQMAGAHGFAQSGVLCLCLWAVTVSLIGARGRLLPLAVCLLGLVPLVRLVGLLGPLGVLPVDLPDGLWIVFMLSIPGVMLWCLVLGLTLVRRARPSVVGGI